MKRIVVLGSQGMLGHEVFSRLKSLNTFDVIGTYNRKIPADTASYRKYEINLTGSGLSQLLEKADYAVNCIAVLMSDIDEKNEASIKKAYEVNSSFPKLLSEAAKKNGTKIFHISTDGVFSGNNESPLNEKTTPTPVDSYGKSKLQGEQIEDHVINIRTSVIGRDPNYNRGLLEWFLKQPENAEISGYEDIWHGATNKQLSFLIKDIIGKNAFNQICEESNIHHFIPNEPVSKFELLNHFKKIFNKKISIKSVPNPKGTINRALSTVYHTLNAVYSGKKGLESALLDLK